MQMSPEKPKNPESSSTSKKAILATLLASVVISADTGKANADDYSTKNSSHIRNKISMVPRDKNGDVIYPEFSEREKVLMDWALEAIRKHLTSPDFNITGPPLGKKEEVIQTLKTAIAKYDQLLYQDDEDFIDIRKRPVNSPDIPKNFRIKIQKGGIYQEDFITKVNHTYINTGFLSGRRPQTFKAEMMDFQKSIDRLNRVLISGRLSEKEICGIFNNNIDTIRLWTETLEQEEKGPGLSEKDKELLKNLKEAIAKNPATYANMTKNNMFPGTLLIRKIKPPMQDGVAELRKFPKIKQVLSAVSLYGKAMKKAKNGKYTPATPSILERHCKKEGRSKLTDCLPHLSDFKKRNSVCKGKLTHECRKKYLKFLKK